MRKDRNSSSQGKLKTSQLPSEEGVKVDEKRTFLSANVAPSVKIVRDGTVVNTQTLEYTPQPGLNKRTSNTIQTGQNNDTIVGFVYQNVPDTDPYYTTCAIAEPLLRKVQDYDDTHPDLAWWSMYPDAVRYLSKPSERNTAGWNTVDWLRANARKLATRCAHEFADARAMEMRHRATLINLLQFMGFKGKDRLTKFAPEIAFSVANAVLNFTGKGFTVPGFDDFLIKYSTPYVGTNTRMTNVFVLPLWKYDFTGNDWCKVPAPESITDLKSANSLKLVGRDSAFSAANGNEEVKDCLAHIDEVAKRYVYYRDANTDKAPWESPFPIHPTVEGVGSCIIQTKDTDDKVRRINVDLGNTRMTTETISNAMPQHHRPKVKTQLMIRLWNAFFWYQEYMMTAHPWLYREGSDLIRIALDLSFQGQPLFERVTMNFDKLQRALAKQKNRDLNSLLDATKYSKSTPNNATFLKFAPFLYDRSNATEVVFNSDSGIDAVFEKNFERYEVDPRNIDPSVALLKAETWPHLNPSVFVSGLVDGQKVHVLNATPTLGDAVDILSPATETGVVRTVKDVVSNISFDAVHNTAEAYTAPLSELQYNVSPNVDLVVCNDYPINGRLMHQPLFDKSDPTQGGIFLLISDTDSMNYDIWSEYYSNLANFAANGAAPSPTKVNAGKVAGNDLVPMVPIYQYEPTDSAKTESKAFVGRRHSANPDYRAYTGDVFVFTGINCLFNPVDIFSASETGYLFQELKTTHAANSPIANSFLATNTDSDTLLNLWEKATTVVAYHGLGTGHKSTNIKAFVRQWATQNSTAGYSGEDDVFRIYVNDPKYGPVLWNLDSLADELSEMGFFPAIQDASVDPMPLDRDVVILPGRCDPVMGSITGAPNLDDTSMEGVANRFRDARPNIGDGRRQYDLLNTKFTKYCFGVQSLRKLGGRYMPQESDKITVELENHGHYIDFSLGRATVRNIGGARALPFYDEIVLPDARPTDIVETEIIPPDFIQVEPKIATVKVNDYSRPSLGKLRNKPRYTFKSDLPSYGAKKGDPWMPGKSADEHKKFFGKRRRTDDSTSSTSSAGPKPSAGITKGISNPKSSNSNDSQKGVDKEPESAKDSGFDQSPFTPSQAAEVKRENEKAAADPITGAATNP